MRKRYIQHPVTLELIPAEDYIDPRQADAPFVMVDLTPYRSMITGEMIEGRRQHRDHLRAHGKVEVGDAWDHKRPEKPRQPAEGRKEAIARQVYEKLRY